MWESRGYYYGYSENHLRSLDAYSEHLESATSYHGLFVGREDGLGSCFCATYKEFTDEQELLKELNKLYHEYDIYR